jgi:hypothetical protein
VKTAMTLPSGFIKFCDFDYLAFHEAHRSVSLVVSVPKKGRRKKKKKKKFSMGNSIKKSVGKPTTRMQGVVQRYALQILGKRGCR